MRLPEVADRLRKLGTLHAMPELAVLAEHIARRTPIKRASPSSRRMTPALASSIRQHASQNPDMTQSAIANLFNVNPGRVSEALRGTRS
jgi:hypothetical protein